MFNWDKNLHSPLPNEEVTVKSSTTTDTTESDSSCCSVCYHGMVCPSVCMLSVTLVHPAKAVGRKEMPFGRELCGPR